MFLLTALAAHASVYTPEDLVVAATRGLPAATTARIAEGVGTDAATAVYLLRRGVSVETLTTWGYVVGEVERAEAERLGALAAAPPVVDSRPWADPRALTAVVYDAGPDVREVLPRRSPRRVHAARGGVGTGAGALLTAAGGVLLLAGSGVVGFAPNVSWATLQNNYGLDSYPGGGRPELVAAGAIGLLAGGVTLHFGARELRLAGAYPGGWEPTPLER